MEMRSSSLCLETLRITRRPVHRIRVPHGCEHLRYASDPSNKECALRRFPRPRAMGVVRQAAGKNRKADFLVGPDRMQWAGSGPSVTSRLSFALGRFDPFTLGRWCVRLLRI